MPGSEGSNGLSAAPASSRVSEPFPVDFLTVSAEAWLPLSFIHSSTHPSSGGTRGHRSESHSDTHILRCLKLRRFLVHLIKELLLSPYPTRPSLTPALAGSVSFCVAVPPLCLMPPVLLPFFEGARLTQLRGLPSACVSSLPLLAVV